MAARRQAVLTFKDNAAATKTPEIRGGKGAGLAQMVDLGLPVPPFFILSTSASRAYAEHGRLPNRVRGQIERGIAELEKITGRTFGDPDNPLLVSVRSGAQVSMPGMMDTILNIGINHSDLSGLSRWGGKHFAHDTRARFLKQWCELLPPHWVRSIYRPSARLQLKMAIEAVLKSWSSERAKAYRQAHGIADHLGTAVTVQAMVFGNVDQQSCTGVVFSANTSTGEEGLFGEFLTQAQGEDIVAGTTTPRPLAEMQAWDPQVYARLKAYVLQLARHFGTIVDVEFTVQQGELFILQVRKAKLTTFAKVVQAVHDVWAKRRTKTEVVTDFTQLEVAQLSQNRFAEGSALLVLAKGLAVSPGATVGKVALSSDYAVNMAKAGESVILVRHDTSPDDLPGMLQAKAIVTATGGATCHAAVVARELGLPAVVGASNLLWSRIKNGTVVSVDGALGIMAEGEVELQEASATKEVNIFLKWYNQLVAYQPRLGFEWVDQQLSANQLLSDFYLSEVMAQRSQGSSLQERAFALRQRVHRKVAESFAVYLAMACTGEVRHFYVGRSTLEARQAACHIDNVITLGRYEADRSPNRIQCDVLPKLQGLSHDALVAYAHALWQVFEKGRWPEAFGGSNWAAIAKALHDFLAGELTLTLFVDRVFDLKHNGGKLFNKHAMFSRLTQEGGRSTGRLFQQLEVKKKESNPQSLLDGLCALDGAPSGEVHSLWEVGKGHKLW